LRHIYVIKILKIELNDAHRNINRSQTELFRLVRDISNHLPNRVAKKFFNRQEFTLNSLYIQKIQKTNEKINRLIQKNTENTIKYITPIKYHSTLINNENKNDDNNLNNDNHPTSSPHSTPKEGIEIEIEPMLFKNSIPMNSLTSIKNNWMINLTSIAIPQDVQCLMQLGENFSLPSNKREKIL